MGIGENTEATRSLDDGRPLLGPTTPLSPDRGEELMSLTGLSDEQRKAIHDFSLEARELLMREVREVLEGTYGLYSDGRMEPPSKLPEVLDDPETRSLHDRLARFLEDEVRAGLPRAEAVEKLIKEIAFTHLNRLVAFKMMEARKLIRGTLDKYTESNAFKFYLAAPEHAGDYARYQDGDVDTVYRHFLLWQCGQVAQEIKVLFDPGALPGRIFPRPRTLGRLLERLNQEELADVWETEETIGWIYQFFNEREKAEVFDRLYKKKQKLRPQDVPVATQLYTPNWIVRFLVQNTLGRLWVQMHPDTRLLGTDLLDYLVPLEGDVPSEPLRPVKEITLLDPACGGMHFGLVAFDLFAAMYREELERAGESSWPQMPSVADAADIPAAIIARNLYGIDIDLRAVQLSALALYLKAKSLNPDAAISDSNLACADVMPLDGARLGAFLREARFSEPIYERLMRKLWDRVRQVNEVGSLLRLERELVALIAEERARYAREPIFAGLEGEYEAEAAQEEFWGILEAQIIQGLDAFARQQAEAGVDQTFFRGEAVKGLRLVHQMMRRYDVVVTNPPYSGSGNLNSTLSDFLKAEYREGKGDLYAAFIQRCSEFLGERGRLGMITQQSFMFLSSYEKLRSCLRDSFVIETMAHTGPHTFVEIKGEKVNNTVFALRLETDTLRRENSVGTYYRLVHAPEGDGKRLAFERALHDGSNTYRVAQRRFDAIPGSPWVYWLSRASWSIWEGLPRLASEVEWKRGTTTADNFRFVRYWWEVGSANVDYRCTDRSESIASGKKWFPYMKGGEHRKWYGNQDSVLNWKNDGKELRAFENAAVRNIGYYFREGITYSSVTSAGLSCRLMPVGFIFDQASNALFARQPDKLLEVLGVLDSALVALVMKLNPTINIVKDDFDRLPYPARSSMAIRHSVTSAVFLQMGGDMSCETRRCFVSPSYWQFGSDCGHSLRLSALEARIDDQVFYLYGITKEARPKIRSELAADLVASSHQPGGAAAKGLDGTELAATREELAVRWVSYAVNVVLGRFRPGVLGALGSAVYRRADFAMGSLPEPEEAEFDELVGPAERFAYVDAEGSRHVFSAQVEGALRQLAVPDGITVLDEGHPRDLPTLVRQALRLMLGEEDGQEVIAEGAKGNLRKFLSRTFFTKWHFKWYRKRPVYWPLQSAGRSYGFVLFHERVGRETLYSLQRDYLDYKRNAVRNTLGDLLARHEGLSGREAKRVEREIEEATKLLNELTQFSETMGRIAREGYEPEENWIDDGVILRLAPLWELIPIWYREPKKYWERLQNGEYDWSHIAMRYWPERVKEKCGTNKSFAIAHGHEEWYEGE